jgi:hypothetical protein
MDEIDGIIRYFKSGKGPDNTLPNLDSMSPFPASISASSSFSDISIVYRYHLHFNHVTSYPCLGTASGPPSTSNRISVGKVYV